MAHKDDVEKVRVDLLPSRALLEISCVLAHGARKYGDNNWRLGMKWSRLYAAAMRHLLCWHSGENIDPESGLSHLSHAACCLLFLMEYAQSKSGEDDRVKDSDIVKWLES